MEKYPYYPCYPCQIVGPSGPEGPRGNTGATGDTGALGFAGDRGFTGPQGLPGNTGPQGPPGPNGSDGETGTQGPQGDTGNPGLSGPLGPDGPQGNTGDTGEQGTTGDDGPDGPQGPQGSDGELPCNPELVNLIPDFGTIIINRDLVGATGCQFFVAEPFNIEFNLPQQGVSRTNASVTDGSLAFNQTPNYTFDFGGYTVGTNTYTVPVAGRYVVTLNIIGIGNPTASASILVNGTITLGQRDLVTLSLQAPYRYTTILNLDVGNTVQAVTNNLTAATNNALFAVYLLN